MAVPVGNNHLANTPANDVNNGGTIFHAGNIDSTNQITKSITPGRTIDTSHSNSPREGATAATASKAVSGGNFAHNPHVTTSRSKTDTGFVMLRLPTILAGVSGGSANSAMYMASATYAVADGTTERNPTPVGAKTLTKWRANQFSWTGTSGSRHNWVDASNAAEAPAALGSSFHKIAGSIYDYAVQVGDTSVYAIPGQLTYHEGKAFPTGSESGAVVGNTTGATRDEYEGTDRSKASSSLVG